MFIDMRQTHKDVKNVNRANPNIQILKILNPKKRKRPLE